MLSFRQVLNKWIVNCLCVEIWVAVFYMIEINAQIALCWFSYSGVTIGPVDLALQGAPKSGEQKRVAKKNSSRQELGRRRQMVQKGRKIGASRGCARPTLRHCLTGNKNDTCAFNFKITCIFTIQDTSALWYPSYSPNLKELPNPLCLQSAPWWETCRQHWTPSTIYTVIILCPQSWLYLH